MPDRAVELHPHHAGLFYALLAAAYGQSKGCDDLLPDGLMLDAPEQCRVSVEAGEPLAFGFTLVRETPAESLATIRMLVGGLHHLGANRPSRPAVLGGNFRVTLVEDLVAGKPLSDSRPPVAVPRALIEEEAERAAELDVLTLHFHSPLRMTRPRGDRVAAVEYFDRDYFNAGTFCQRVVRRLHELGLVTATLPSGGESPLPALVISPADLSLFTAAEVVENRLVWMDFAYGPRSAKSGCFGAIGRVRLRVARRDVRRAIVWAQYARLGQSTRFGQGAFRIEELGDDPFPCRRSIELVDLCLRRLDIDAAAERYELPAGSLRRAASELRKGHYQPKQVTRVPIVQADGRERTLAIPMPIDRGLQYSVHSALAPAIDRLFEESSVAYRRGLGRTTAVRRIREASRLGFRFGLRADFRRFFDSIPHDVLRDRIEAFLGDATMAKLLMRWVVIGAPAEGMGIPTGAPISPLLANLFLDQFDEEMRQEGAFLVRYADDFVLLYRTKEEADAVFARATESARSLELELNAKKTHHFGPDSGFDFVGYRFERRDRWTAEPTGQPQPLDQIGWQQAPKPEAPFAMTALPGESDGPLHDDRAIVVVGPRCTQVRREGDDLIFTRQGEETRSPLRDTRELILIGTPTIAGPALEALVRDDIRVIVTDDRGFVVASLTSHEAIESPEAVAGQVACAHDERWSLALGKLLIGAKIRNYRALAAALTDPSDESVVALAALEERAHGVESIESLLGVEGAAAARWYRLYGRLLPSWCRFERRVAPNAEDPGNVLLNIAMTALHRQVIAAVRAAGLIPTMGILHAPRAAHAALASDLQEPFRHLMDRAVLHVARRLKPGDFSESRTGDSDHRLTIRPKATVQLTTCLHETFAVTCLSESSGEHQSYRTHLIKQARSLKRHLIDRAKAFTPFKHATR